MVRGYQWSLEQNPKRAYKLAALCSFVLISLTLSSIRAEHRYGRNRVWSEEVTAIRRRTDITRSTEFQEPGPRRGVLQAPDSSSEAGTTNVRPLAVKGGRRDPFHGFHKYRGGYNIKSKHYWGSLAFTGIPGYALAVGWLLVGLLSALSLCCAGCCCTGQPLINQASKPPHVLYFWSAVLMVSLLSIAAIGSCVVVYVGSTEFSGEARKVKDALVDAADNATNAIQLVTVAIEDVEQILEPFGTTSGISLGSLNSTEITLTQASEQISHTIHKNTRVLDKAIKYLEIIVIVVTSVIALLTVVGPVCVLLRWRRFFYFVVSVAWILTAVTAVLFGIDLASSNLVADTCDAINEYEADPTNTTLNALLPCEDLLSASGALVDVSQGIYDSFTMVNKTFNQIQQQLNYTLPTLCEPIGPPPSYQLIGSCPNNTIAIDDLPQVVEPFSCSSNDTQACDQQGKLLTDIQYKTIVAYAAGVSTLLNIYPSIGGLSNCSIVVYAFTGLLDHNCHPTKTASHINWGASLALAIAMMLLLIWWLPLTNRSRQKNLWRGIFPANPVMSDQEVKNEW